jgi:hypothetical protein
MDLKKGMFFVIACVILSCKKENESSSIINLKSEIEVSLSQDVDDRGPYPVLKISTIDSLECINAKFLINNIDNVSEVEVQINGITIENGICEVGNDKIYEDFRLKNQNHSMIFNIKNFSKSKADFFFTPKESKIKFETQDGIRIKNNEILNIENNSCWGSVLGTDEQVKKFKEILKQSEDIPNSIQEGNYGIFSYENGWITTHQYHPKFFIKDAHYNFFIKYINWVTLKSNILEFSKNNPQLIFRICNSQGQIIEK